MSNTRQWITWGIGATSAVFGGLRFFFDYADRLQPDYNTIFLILLVLVPLAWGSGVVYFVRGLWMGILRSATITTFEPVLRETRIKRGSNISIEIRVVTRPVPIKLRLRLFCGYIEILIRDANGQYGSPMYYFRRRDDPIEGDFQLPFVGNRPLELGWRVPEDAVPGEYTARIFLKDIRPHEWIPFQKRTYVMAERTLQYTVMTGHTIK